MNLQEYSALAIRTESKYSGPSFMRLMHGALGIGTEVVELFSHDEDDSFNVKEECGDVMWYVNIFVLALGEELSYESDDDMGHTSYPFVDGLVVLAGDVLDAVKRHVFYNAPIDKPVLMEKINNIIFLIIKQLRDYSFSLAECLDCNIAKLKARYPKGFSDYRAINRDVDKERNAM